MSAVQFEGMGMRAGGVGRRPALVIVDVNNGFTDRASPLVCELDETVEARIFFRNCANLGLAIVRCPGAVDAASDGSAVVIETTGSVEVDGVRFAAPPAPPFLLELGDAGGLVEWTARQLGA